MPTRPTARSTAETKKFLAEARSYEAEAGIFEINLQNAEDDRNETLASDWHARVYRYTAEIDEESILECMEALAIWSRLDEPTEYEIVFTSPGGDMLCGFGLFDFIRSLSRQGFEMITTDLGYSASMAGLLLQAGDVRRIGAESWLHIHENAWDHKGKFSTHEDEVNFSKRLLDRMVSIYVARSNGKMDEETFREMVIRKEAWFDAQQALDYGFVDEII